MREFCILPIILAMVVCKIIYEICNVTKESVSGVYVASCGGVYVNRLKQIGVEHFTIPDVSSKSPKDVVEIIHELAKIVRERHINIIQCHHRMAVLFARMIHANAQIVYVNHTTYLIGQNLLIGLCMTFQ